MIYPWSPHVPRSVEGEVEVRAFNHPGGELHNLLCRETLLCNESADNHLTDTERCSGLLHGEPQPLI